jgi:hypothetical protein
MPTSWKYCNGCEHARLLSDQIKSVHAQHMRAKIFCAVLLTLLCFSLAANMAFMYVLTK